MRVRASTSLVRTFFKRIVPLPGVIWTLWVRRDVDADLGIITIGPLAADTASLSTTVSSVPHGYYCINLSDHIIFRYQSSWQYNALKLAHVILPFVCCVCGSITEIDKRGMSFLAFNLFRRTTVGEDISLSAWDESGVERTGEGILQRINIHLNNLFSCTKLH